MPGLSRAAHEEEQSEGGEDEEWELGSLAKGGADGKRDEDDDGVFGSTLEREGWEQWVRDGEPEGRWARILRRISRLVGLQRDALASTPEEGVALSSAAAAARLTPAQYDRTLKFPPFHLLPRNLTVTDVKANRRKPPPLVSLQSLLTTASNGVLGAAGSSYGIKLTTIEGLRDLMQMFALLITAGSPTLSTLQSGSASSHQPAESTAVRILFVTIPSFLSLDFVAAFGQALVFLFVLTAVTFAALYEFYRFTGGWHGPAGKLGQGKLDLGEGFDREDLGARRTPWRDSYAWRVAVTFWCGSVYLPLSRLAIGALAWTDDYWDVPNPYELFSSETPSPPPLGPSSDWFDPMDFCYRTTMRRRTGFEHLNFAYVLLPLAGLVIVILSLWFPWRQHKVVKSEAPTVDGWTELGEHRRNHNAEYARLLDVDPSPFNFLYRDYRKRWALLFKLVNVLLVVLIQKNNCLLRTYTTLYLSIVRQGCLLAFMALFCILSAWSSPYLTLISNSSDLISRIGFVLFALLGLLAALSIPGTDSAVVLTNVVVYGLNIYFALIGTSSMQSIVKKLRRRLDFSVDIFSPDLDLAKHLGRRVWQESLAALFLCSPDLAMAPKQKLAFAQEPGLPPYLLNFSGSPAERFIENLKILREIGLDTYSDAVRSLDTSPDSYIMRLRRLIELQHTGPDMFYKPPDLSLPLTSFFGRVDVVPFPFIVVFRFDQNPTQPLHLVEEAELELLVQQNRQPEIVAARKVRLALRALEGQLIFAPHVKVHRLGSTGRTDVERHISYRMARVRIVRNSAFLWQGCNVSSGFDVSLQYADGEGPGRDGRMQRGQKLTLAAPDVGIDDTFQLTAKLAALLVRNRTLVDQRLPIVESALQRHRDFFRVEAERKHQVLSHAFLLTVFGENQLSGTDLDSVLRSSEENVKVQTLALSYKAAVNRLEQRMEAVTKDSTRGWWYLFWDDLWRRNHNIGLRDRDFSPHYASSICYHPMARKELELFLQSRGADVGRRAYFHPGFLNRLYVRPARGIWSNYVLTTRYQFYLDEQMFSSTSHAIPLHLTSSPNAIPFNHLSHAFQHHHTTSTSEHSDPFTRRNASQGTHFTVNTGGGTDEDDPEIRQRAAFIYEEVFERPLPRFRDGSRIAWARFQVQVRAKQWVERFLGLEPCVRDWRPSEDDGVMLDLRWTKGGWRAPPSASAKEKPEQL
ncbi:hypothetical protein Rhopal_007368-T1 [Rhodotorula paludigena]|uniref:Proteophosphoglycan ppg4 n=1 Tax=Rhodotorula paludigena TaxID=86838 RepID=A0AAV5GYM5_9BASI|nr:hypothetical protein Rhopal_007368-T1 [Rhodotorula paludigena]